MAFQQGTANDVAALLTIISTFAQAQGWTQDRASNISVDDDDLLLSKGSLFFSMLSEKNSNRINIKGNTGFDNLQTWDNQPGASSFHDQANLMTGPFTQYYLYAPSSGPDYIHCVVEISAGLFTHIVFGELNKFGTYTGGAYFGALHWNNSQGNINNGGSTLHSVLFDYQSDDFNTANGGVRADVDLKTWSRFTFDGAQTPNRAFGGARGGLEDGLIDRTPNEYNMLNPTIPITVAVERTLNAYSPVGSVPDLREINIGDLVPGEELTIGGDTWQVFPYKSKNPGAGLTDFNSGQFAYAYKKIV